MFMDKKGVQAKNLDAVLAICNKSCYSVHGATHQALPIYGRRLAPFAGGSFCPLDARKGGCNMETFVTYEGLFQFAMFLVTFAALLLSNKKK